MKRVGQALLSPWFLYPLGAVLLSLLVWFAFPFIAFGGFEPFDNMWVRIGLIIFIVLLFALLLFLRWRKGRKADKDLVEGIAGVAADPTGEAISAERQQVEAKLRAALADLKQTLGKGGQALYQLPWYAIIGPPGAGKTTALLNSGLRFPLAERHGAQALKGVGGTRDCDWWFTEKAVILDTAGRWTTQDSDSRVDQAAWGNFLGILKRTRERQPLNGILVVFGVAGQRGDLLNLTADERTAYARSVRTRLLELQSAFGLMLPIYVVLTKLDMIAGFVEFFDDLDREGREQVLGLTLPLGTGNKDDMPQFRFSALFDRLIERQRSRLLDRLQSERDLGRRTLIYGFPSQFASLGRVIDELLAETFNDSRFASRLSLRGVYFTSATQQGSPIDRLMEAISGKFGIQRQQLPAQVGQGRGFFLRRLFDDVVFNEAGLVGTNPKVERRRAIIRYAAFAATGLFFLTAVGLWTWSYFDNRALIAKVEEEVRRLEPQIADAERQRAAARTAPDFDPRKHLRLLNELRGLPTGYDAQQSKTRAAVGFGLGQSDRLALQTTELYKRGLRALLLPHIMVHAQTRMAAVLNKQRPAAPDDATANEFLFEALKAYLLLGETERINSTYRRFMVDWFKNDFSDTSGFTTGDANALATHIAALVEDPTWDRVTLDQALIARVRDRISALTVSSRALRWLESDEGLRNRPTWRVIDNVGAQRLVAEQVLLSQRGTPLSTISIPYLYTRAGYYEFFIGTVAVAAAAANADAWVLQQSTLTGAAAINQVVAQTVKDYMERYINYYRRVIEDIRVVRLNDLGQSADVLNKLSSRDSPIRNLYEAITQQTRLSQVQKVGPEFLPQRRSIVQRLRLNLEELLQWLRVAENLLGDGGKAGMSVDREFEALHRLVGPERAQSSELTSFLDNFRLLALKASDARGGDEAALRQLIQMARQLSDSSGQFPRPLPEIARTIAVDISNLGTKGTREQMAAAWDSQIFNICQRNIVNMYPINLGAPASRDATPDDFADMFGKGGRIDKFTQQYLHSYLDSGSNPWRWKPEAQSLAFNSQVPVMLQAAAEIQDSFFSPGGGSLGVIFTMRALEGQAKGSGLEIAGDTMQLEPQSGPKNISWPSGAGRGARVFSDINDQRFDGQWAFMRMMVASSPAGNGPEWRLRLSNGVTLQLEFQKPKNPLTVRPLLIQRKFQCVPLLQQ